jgi:LacI family transcriptional regulator
MVKKPLRHNNGTATIADVAKEAGFSPMTVSRVINGDKNVRDSTRQSIHDAIAKLDYAPNLAARSLAGKSNIRIGLLYSNPSASYLSEFLLGSLTQSRINHFQLVVEKCEPDQQEADVAEELIKSGIDGIILPPPLCDSIAIHKVLAKYDTLAVAVASGKPPKNLAAVSINDFEAAAAMTRHIIAQGHSRIGFITGHPNQTASDRRLQGYKTAILEAGLPLDEQLIAKGLFTYRSGMTAADELLNLEHRPTAIFASNDDMAAATVAVAHRRNFDIPQDITVCGFDDTDFSRSIWPELTTIHQPIADMSREAVNILGKAIRARRNGEAFAQQHRNLEFTLIKRDSDSAPK